MAPALAPTRRRWILFLAAAGLSGYGAYRIHQLPSVSAKRRKLVKLFTALFSVADAISSSADAVALLSSDLKNFLRSDSDEIPTSLTQLSKVARSDEFSASISRLSDAIAVGIIRGLRFRSASDSPVGEARTSSSFSDRLFSDKGSAFASAVVGSFARSVVTAFFYCRGEAIDSCDAPPGWVDLICTDKCRELIAGSVQLFVRTAVSVYLEKTMEVNACEALFSGLTNPRHEAKVKDILVSVCNGAVETLVKTSHGVLSGSNLSSSINTWKDVNRVSLPRNLMGSDDIKREDGSGGLVERVSSVLAVPSNRQFVLDVTGRVTFESVRSFLKFVMWNLQDGMKRSVSVVNERVVERGMDVMRYLSAKAMFAFSLCIALCMGVAAGQRVLSAA